MYTAGSLKPDPKSVTTSWDYQDDCPDCTGAWLGDDYVQVDDCQVLAMPADDSRRAA